MFFRPRIVMAPAEEISGGNAPEVKANHSEIYESGDPNETFDNLEYESEASKKAGESLKDRVKKSKETKKLEVEEEDEEEESEEKPKKKKEEKPKEDKKKKSDIDTLSDKQDGVDDEEEKPKKSKKDEEEEEALQRTSQKCKEQIKYSLLLLDNASQNSNDYNLQLGPLERWLDERKLQSQVLQV